MTFAHYWVQHIVNGKNKARHRFFFHQYSVNEWMNEWLNPTTNEMAPSMYCYNMRINRLINQWWFRWRRRHRSGRSVGLMQMRKVMWFENEPLAKDVVSLVMWDSPNHKKWWWRVNKRKKERRRRRGNCTYRESIDRTRSMAQWVNRTWNEGEEEEGEHKLIQSLPYYRSAMVLQKH